MKNLLAVVFCTIMAWEAHTHYLASLIGWLFGWSVDGCSFDWSIDWLITAVLGWLWRSCFPFYLEMCWACFFPTQTTLQMIVIEDWTSKSKSRPYFTDSPATSLRSCTAILSITYYPGVEVRGWAPHGAVFFSRSAGRFYCHQAKWSPCTFGAGPMAPECGTNGLFPRRFVRGFTISVDSVACRWTLTPAGR